MSSLTVAKSSTLRRFFQGLLLILFGALLIRSPFVLLSPLVVAIGVIIAAKSFGRLARIFAREQLLRGSRDLHEHFARETLARKVFWLLLAIAEVDGRAEAREFDMVRRFLMERFVDPVTAEDLRSWTAQRIPTDQIEPLTQRLRFILSHAECETIFFWCCLVAFADGQFNPDEHLVLQKVAHAFGFPPDHAWRIFHHAKQRHVEQELGTGGSGTRGRPLDPRDERSRALEFLGLEAGATKDEIRSRHRELVKQHHPDAHAHLGPVAAQEATVRFREIQSAYELLTDGR